jgi:hypothetical protein
MPVTPIPTPGTVLTPAQIATKTAAQKVPMQKGPLPIPRRPPSTEKWSFRNVRGTRETIRAAITNARLTDPITRKPGDQPLPAEVTAYLLWILNNRKGDIFVLDGHVHAGSDSEWLEHLHLKKWA